jgi:hypothetical protein
MLLSGKAVHERNAICARHMSGGKVSTEVRALKTTTEELMALLAWLTDQGVTHIAFRVVDS